jgi:hypothetical protein
MRAASRSRYGFPEVVRIRQVGAPDPGAHDLLVKVHATTVNRTDCHGPGVSEPDPANHQPLLGARKVLFAYPNIDQAMVRYFALLMESGQVTALIDRSHPLGGIADAYRYVETRQKIGNVVITSTRCPSSTIGPGMVRRGSASRADFHARLLSV